MFKFNAEPNHVDSTIPLQSATKLAFCVAAVRQGQGRLQQWYAEGINTPYKGEIGLFATAWMRED